MAILDFMKEKRVEKTDRESRELAYRGLGCIQKGFARYDSQKMAERFDSNETIEMIVSVLGLRDAKGIDLERPFDRMDEDKLLRFTAYSDWKETGFFSELDTYDKKLAKSLLVQTSYFRGCWAHRKPISDEDLDYFLVGARKLLELIDSPEASEIERIRKK